MFSVQNYLSPCPTSDYNATSFYVVEGINYNSTYPLPSHFSPKLYGAMPKQELAKRLKAIETEVYGKTGLIGLGLGRMLKKCVLPMWKMTRGCVKISEKACSSVANVLKQNFHRAVTFCLETASKIPENGLMKCVASSDPIQLREMASIVRKKVAALLSANTVTPASSRNDLTHSLLVGAAVLKEEHADEDHVPAQNGHDEL